LRRPAPATRETAGRRARGTPAPGDGRTDLAAIPSHPPPSIPAAPEIPMTRHTHEPFIHAVLRATPPPGRRRWRRPARVEATASGPKHDGGATMNRTADGW
jgi:hypothetical protein